MSPALKSIASSISPARCLPLLCGIIIGCECSSDVITERLSPDKRQKAVVFVRNCGATEAFQTGVTIVAPNQGTGNLEPSILLLGTPNSGMSGTTQDSILRTVSVDWLSDTTLVVSYDGRAKVWFQVAVFRGHAVRYLPRTR